MSDVQTSASTSSEATPRTAPNTGPGAQSREARPHTSQTLKHGSVIATPERREGGEVRTLRSSTEPSERSFTDHQKQMLANLDKHGDVAGPEAADAAKLVTTSGSSSAAPPDPAPVVKSAPSAAPAPPAVAAQVPAAAAVPATPPVAPAESAKPDAELTARVERLAEHNKRLVAELDKRRAAPEPDERTKSLDEIERGLTTDFMGSIRKLVALNAGVKDPSSPEVDKLMSSGYSEWTAHELKTQLDPAQRALTEAQRNRLLIDRDKREREATAKATEAKTATEAEQQRDVSVGRQLGQHLETSKHAERYPLMMKHAQTFDRAAPGDLLWAAIRRGIKAGEFTQDTPDDKLIDHYSKEIETYYQSLRDKLVEVPPTSTAPPAQAIVPPTDNKADATQPGVRTITNVSASVAPPTQPVAAASPAPSDDSGPPKRKPKESEEAFRSRAARYRFGGD